nr:hypothetical protein [Tanacetum cinerariifolium]
MVYKVWTPGCTLLREKLEEDLVTYFQKFQDTSESSDGSTNVVNAPREPFVVKQDHGVNPPHIDECCCECGEALDGIICQRCAYQFGDLHPQQHLCCDNCEGLHETSQCQPMNQNFYNSNSLGFDQTQPPQFPVVHPPPQKTSIEISHDQENNRPAIYDDDDDVDYTTTITPVLSTEEPDNSLSMGDEHLDTIPAMESDEVIKSSIEDLVPIPSEFKGIPDTMCDVHLFNNPTPLEAKDHFEFVVDSNDDISSSDDDSLCYENIEYVEASPCDSELVSLEVEKIVISEDEEIEDDNLRENLLKVNLLIAEIEALKDNPIPSSEFLTKSSSISPKSVLEGTNTFHNYLPEFKNFFFDLEEISSGNTTTHSDISLSEYEAFSFYDDHIEEISSGSTTTQFDISLPEYDSFIFDLSNDQFPPTDGSNFTHE